MLLLLTFDNNRRLMLLSTSERRQLGRTARSPAGHSGSVDSEDSGSGSAAWLGNRAANPAGIAGSAAGGAGIAVSGADPAGTARLDRLGVERLRQQPPRQVLLTHRVRRQAAKERVGRVGAAVRGHRADLAAELGTQPCHFSRAFVRPSNGTRPKPISMTN